MSRLGNRRTTQASAQGKTAPRDAYLYFISPSDGDTVKSPFWCRFGLRNMGVALLVATSFNPSRLTTVLQGFSLRWYADFFGSSEWMRALSNSLIVAPTATLLAMLFGTLAAIGLTRGEFRGKALVMSLLISPMIVPVVIIGVASYLFFAPLGMGNSYLSLILVHAVLGVPFVIITVSATLQGFNYNLVRAAASLGAATTRGRRPWRMGCSTRWYEAVATTRVTTAGMRRSCSR